MRKAANLDATAGPPREAAFADRFAAVLIAERALEEMTVGRARRAMRDSGERFDTVLTRLGPLSEADTARHLAAFLGRPLIAAADIPEAPLTIPGLDAEFLRRTALLPVREDGDALLVASADPFATEPAEALSYLLSRPVHLAVAAPADVARALHRLYAPGRNATHSTAPGAPADERASEDAVRRLAALASEAPVIRAAARSTCASRPCRR
mgnify:FL=1